MLDLVAASAPNGDNRSAAAATALSLRNLMRAIEAEQLLVTDPASAGPDAVAAAGATRVAHADALDDALTKLESAASTGPTTAPTADATRPSDSA